MNAMSRRAHIGLAVGADSITAVAHRADTEHVIVHRFAGDVAAALHGAISALRAALDAAFGVELAGATADIALLPPLAETRLLQLPPLRPAEAAAVIRRDANRYFLDVPAPLLVAVPDAKRAPGVPLLAGAASADLVEAIRAAVTAAGWRCRIITTADAAWLAAATERTAAVIAVHGSTAHIIRVDNGAPVALRRVPASQTEEVVAAAGAAGAAQLFVAPAERDALRAALGARGWLESVDMAAPVASSSADVAAARFAGRSTIVITPATAVAERRDTERRVAVRLAVAAVLLLVASAAVELWGAARELDEVRGRRAEIRAQVGPLLAARDSLELLSMRAVDVENVARTAPRWTGALFDLAMLLPHESYITRLHATGDTLVVDGEGVRAGAALQALRGAGSLRDAQLLGTVDRELADGSTALERFRLRARLASSATVQP